MPREIDAGPLTAAAGALLLLVSLFLDWFEPGFSAWTVFEALDLVLAALAIATMLAVLPAVGLRSRMPERALAWVGAAAFVIVASQLIDHPPAVLDQGLELGAWLALLGTVLMLIGGFVSAARISLAVRVEQPGGAAGPAGGPAAPGSPASPAPAPASPASPAPAPGSPATGAPAPGSPASPAPAPGSATPPHGDPIEDETRTLDDP